MKRWQHASDLPSKRGHPESVVCPQSRSSLWGCRARRGRDTGFPVNKWAQDSSSPPPAVQPYAGHKNSLSSPFWVCNWGPMIIISTLQSWRAIFMKTGTNHLAPRRTYRCTDTACLIAPIRVVLFLNTNSRSYPRAFGWEFITENRSIYRSPFDPMSQWNRRPGFGWIWLEVHGTVPLLCLQSHSQT